MYPNLYYLFKDWFGVEWKGLQFLNMFGLMVALSFIAAAIFFTLELKRKEKQGLLLPREEVIIVGKPASFYELLINAFIGFLFGYKLLGLFIDKADDVSAQDYIFSKQGSMLGGLAVAVLLAALKWWDKNKQKLKEPERRNIRIWPHDRVGDIVVIALLFGVLGAKLFDAFENWDSFIADPAGTLFSAAGLTFYGGLIVAAVAVCWYAYKKGIKLTHLTDAAAPALLIAYAIGRIGCQVAGDGDWGIYNSAYITDDNGKVIAATPEQYKQQLQKYDYYFLHGTAFDSGMLKNNNGRTNKSLDAVPAISFKAPSFLPTWMVAYNYPGNVNKDGPITLPSNNSEHNKVLPIPVFPTPFYETVIAFILFLFLWGMRKKIKVPGVMFGVYLILNGLERFFIEKIRVNTIFIYNYTQAEIIAILIILAGIALIIYQKAKAKQPA